MLYFRIYIFISSGMEEKKTGTKALFMWQEVMRKSCYLNKYRHRMTEKLSIFVDGQSDEVVKKIKNKRRKLYVTCAKRINSKIYHNSTINTFPKHTLCFSFILLRLFFGRSFSWIHYSRWLIATIKLLAITFQIPFFSF